MKASRWRLLLLLVLAILVTVRLVAPIAIESYLNRNVLADLGDYQGRLEDVDLALWRTSIRLEQIQVEKTVGHPRVVFINVPAATVQLRPTSLWRGVIRIDVDIESPEVNFVDAERAVNQQVGSGLRLGREKPTRKPLFEREIGSLSIHDGTIAFRNFTSEPTVNLQLTNLRLEAENLTASEPHADVEMPGRANMSAFLLEGSSVEAEARFNPVDYQRFEFASEASIDNLTSLNDFFEAYANLDFSSGHGSVVMELRANEGRLSGYGKFAFDSVNFVNLERTADPLELLWDGAADVAAALLSNSETGKIATRVPLSGQMPETMNLDGWSAIASMVHNAFMESMDTGFAPITEMGNDTEDESDKNNNGNGAADE